MVTSSTTTPAAKPPPSPSLTSTNGSVLSFPCDAPAPLALTSGPASSSSPMMIEHHRLSPLEEDKIEQQLRNCDPIRYAAYRTASKLDVIQQALKLGAVNLSVVCSVLQHHGLSLGGAAGEGEDLVLDAAEAGEVISDVFYATSKARNFHYSPPMDVPALTAAALRLALRIFGGGSSSPTPDEQQQQQQQPESSIGILVKSLKVFLVVLCDGRLREKFLYLFRQFINHGSNYLTRDNLSSLLGTLVTVAGYFGESLSFGRNLVDVSVNQCFGRFGGNGLSEESFCKWLLLEPQILVWLPTHYRLVSAKGVRHGIMCKACTMEDIIGMRYQCLRCLKYNLCQHCFFYGHASRNHKLEHPMQEYCYRSTRRDSTKAFLKLLFNNLRNRKLGHCKQRYLCPASAAVRATNASSAAFATEKSDYCSSDESSGFHSDGETPPPPLEDAVAAAVTAVDGGGEQKHRSSSRVNYDPSMDHNVIRKEGEQIISQHQQLFNSIVLHMEEHNNEMLDRLRKMENREKQPLDNCVSMQVQLNRLKSLMDAIFSSKPASVQQKQQQQQLQSCSSFMIGGGGGCDNGSLNDPSVIESTPVVRHGRRSGFLLPMDRNFSPIVMKSSGIKTNGTIQQSMNGHSSSLSITPATATGGDQTSMMLPSLTEMTMGDLSSLLVKTGKMDQQAIDLDVDRLNITEKLTGGGGGGDQQNGGESEETVMQELETLMLRLDSCFQMFHGQTAAATALARNGKDLRVGNIVAEIGDQIHNFAYQFRLDHEL